MRTTHTFLMAAMTAALGLVLGAGPYHVEREIKIGGDGGWDYMTVDSSSHLLYVPRSTHVQVIDPAAGKVLGDVPGQQRNHGVAVVDRVGRGFVTDGKAGVVHVFDLKTYEPLGQIKAAEDADGIVLEPVTGRLFVACGDASALICIDPETDPKADKSGEKIDLGGKPESLSVDGHGRVYVALEDKDLVAVVDAKERKVVARWPVGEGAGSPVGLAVDGEHGRVYVGCRKPQKLVMLDATADGRILGSVPIGAGCDATVCDGEYALASCRDGTLAVARDQDGKLELVQTVQTAAGARTCGVDTAEHRLYLPTAEFNNEPGKSRPSAKPNTFKIIVVGR